TGVWCWTDALASGPAADFARRVEALGYDALWIPEAVGRHPFAHAAWLLASTERLVVATGIASIYARDAQSSAAARNTLAEQSGGRFLLGLGVSHVPLVEDVRGHHYGKPVATMRAYLEAMEKAPYSAVPPAETPPTVIAALGPKMLTLAAEKTRGAHPYLVPPEHTARAREILGPVPWLCTEQKVLLETNASRAREVARRAAAMYLQLPNYRNNLKRLGYTDADLDDGGSDRLIDAVVAWGDEKAIADRIQAHRDAGASHVCIQPLHPEGKPLPDERILEALAPKR
ncbi:MAG: TIGR03620 family F420-dependent LLM class oxidoreductase, partial [Myxococcales bacterium]|nr:TIGR03620 family F420-dependent LLM class oxidoreductase [Myxococcales bacterium]